MKKKELIEKIECLLYSYDIGIIKAFYNVLRRINADKTGFVVSKMVFKSWK